MNIEFIINSVDENELTALKTSVTELRQAGHQVEGRVTFESGDAMRFARQAADAGADLVIAAGGDGTLNEVVNGLVGEQDDSAKRPALGIVPLGTANDFACYMQLPEDIAEAVKRAVSDDRVTADVACVNRRRFLNVSSGGLGAEATDEASSVSKKLLGSVAYFVTGARKFASLAASEALFTTGEETIYEGPFLFYAVGNGTRTGGGNWVTPKADLSDGLLDLCIVQEVGHAELLRLLPLLRSGQHVDHPHVIYRQLAELTVRGHGPISVNVDGEPVEESNLHYSLMPAALRIAGTPTAEAPGLED